MYKSIYDFIEEKNIVLSEYTLKSMREADMVDSLQIEGTTMSKPEIAAFLDTRVTVANKSIKEYLEIINYEDILPTLNNELRNKHFKIDVEFIQFIHQTLMHNILPKDKIGMFRQEQVYLTCSAYIPPEPERLSSMVLDLCRSFEDNFVSYDGFRQIIKFMYDFEKIHPFVDGNGRTGRLLMNYLLLNRGYCYLWIPFSYRSDYLKSFENFEECLYLHTRLYMQTLHKAGKIKQCPICGKFLLSEGFCVNNCF